MTTEPLIRNISDTALWVAMYRAWETEQPNPVFRDPYARRLAGARGEEIMAKIKVAHRHAWSYTARTWNIDSFVKQEIANGADMVIDLAAGLDTRPYRMELPSSLQWIEIDLPEMLTYKDQLLHGEKPVCRLERIPLDLANAAARRALFEELGRAAKRAVIISEGLIVYLTAAEVCTLARDLAAPASFQRWATDLVSPRLLAMLQKQVGSQLRPGRSPPEIRAGTRPRLLHRVRLDSDRSALNAANRRSAETPPNADAPLRPLSRHERNKAEADLGRGRAVGEEITSLRYCQGARPIATHAGRRRTFGPKWT
jgi:methyltransferase (TIGR00027 family)